MGLYRIRVRAEPKSKPCSDLAQVVREFGWKPEIHGLALSSRRYLSNLNASKKRTNFGVFQVPTHYGSVTGDNDVLLSYH